MLMSCVDNLTVVALTLLVSVQPIRNDADETILCLVSFRDVTQQQPVVANSNETPSLADGTSHAPKVNGRPYIVSLLSLSSLGLFL